MFSQNSLLNHEKPVAKSGLICYETATHCLFLYATEVSNNVERKAAQWFSVLAVMALLSVPSMT